MKILACIGFMILGIIIDVGGVPTDDRGYIGGRYWFVFLGYTELDQTLTTLK
jgi:amino acid permease